MCDEILFKFEWQIEKLYPEIDVGPVSVSTPALNNIKNDLQQVAKSYHIIKYKNRGILKQGEFEKSDIYNNFLAKED